MQRIVKSTFIQCNCHVCKWKNASIKDLIALSILMIFMYSFRREKEGGVGVALMHVYMYRKTQSAFTTKSLDKCLQNFVGMKKSWPRTCVLAFRSDQRKDKNRSQGGSSSSKNVFSEPEGYSKKKKRLHWCTNQWYRRKWEEVLLFFVPFQILVLAGFDVELDLIISTYFCFQIF